MTEQLMLWTVYYEEEGKNKIVQIAATDREAAQETVENLVPNAEVTRVLRGLPKGEFHPLNVLDPTDPGLIT